MRRAIALFLLLVICAAPARANPAPPASLALVLAIDVSGSVDAESFILQRDGIASAFASRRVLDAIAGQPGGIEALFLEWSSPGAAAVPVGWTRIVDAQSARAFAAAVHRAGRTSYGLTGIGSAIAAAAREFARLPRPAARRVIDISGDGIANSGMPPRAARDAAVRAGITINGLAILTHDPWLAAYYRDNVIGGPAAFVASARTFGDFAQAMLRKLAQEVAGAPAPFAQMQ